jgi:hypothetical protein
MYEEVAEKWIRYTARLGSVLPQGDQRFLVSAEAHTRFGQLDLILAEIAVGLRPQPDDAVDEEAFLAVWDWVSIYTDAFYFFAWRLIDLLDDGDFPHLAKIDAPGLIAVRSEMLAHPERQSGYFRHALELRDELSARIAEAVEALEGGTG